MAAALLGSAAGVIALLANVANPPDHSGGVPKVGLHTSRKAVG